MSGSRAICAFLICGLLAACATIPNIDDVVLAEPVNCDTAERDLMALEQMRPTRERTALVFLSMITPGGLISGALSNDMGDRGRIFDGSFAQEVQVKKTTIRETCALNRAVDPVSPTRPAARNVKMQKTPPEGEALDRSTDRSDG